MPVSPELTPQLREWSEGRVDRGQEGDGQARRVAEGDSRNSRAFEVTRRPREADYEVTESSPDTNIDSWQQ